MPNITVNCSLHEGDPTAQVLTVPEAGPFISFTVSDGLSIYTRGYGAECAQHARAIAAELLRAADEVDALMAVDRAEQEAVK